MFSILIILTFILGASIGSFLSVVIDRINRKKKGIILGHSECPHCKKRLTSIELIPVLSYLLQNGKCRHCGKKISPNYLYLELFTGIVFTALLLRFPILFEAGKGYDLSWKNLIEFTLNLIYGGFFVAIFFFDLEHQKIPDLFLFPLIGITTIGALITGTHDVWSIAMALGISAIFFGGQILISKGKWLGEGDLLLAVSMSLIFGWQQLLVAIIITYLIGGIVSAILLSSKKVTGKTHVPFAPFLVLGTLITILFGQDILSWYIGSLTL